MWKYPVILYAEANLELLAILLCVYLYTIDGGGEH